MTVTLTLTLALAQEGDSSIGAVGYTASSNTRSWRAKVSGSCIGSNPERHRSSGLIRANDHALASTRLLV